MARTPPQYAQLMDEPTIIIDPSLYLPPPRTALGTLKNVTFGVARALVVAMLASATVYSVGHVLKYQTLTHGMHEHQVAAAPAAEVAHAQTAQAHDVTFASVSPAAVAAPAPAVKVEPQPAVQSLAVRAPEAPAPGSQAVEDDADSLMTRVREGRRHLAAGRYDEAETAFRAVLAQRSSQPAALSGVARVYLKKGRLDDALVFAERAVQAAPYQAAYHLVLGDVLRASGNSAGAQTEYDLAQQLRPAKTGEDRALPPNPFN